jgi:hypothetical protein
MHGAVDIQNSSRVGDTNTTNLVLTNGKRILIKYVIRVNTNNQTLSIQFDREVLLLYFM